MSKTYGIHPKIRTADQINQEYNFHAASTGHKTALIQRYEKEIPEHLDKQCALMAEMDKLPKASQILPTASEPIPTPDAAETPTTETESPIASAV